MKQNYLLGLFLSVALFIGCASTTVNSYGYKIKNDTSNAYFEITPVLCDGEVAETLVDTAIPIEGTQKHNLKIFEVMVFSETEKGENRYFWADNYQYFQKPNGKTEFFIADNAEKVYITIDDIFPSSIANQYANTILFLFGGTTGSGNISSRNQIKREELAAGKQLRQRPMFYWKEKYPFIYNRIMKRLPYWSDFDTEVQAWLAKIVKDENITGYENLLATVEKASTTPKQKVDPVTTYRGEEAVDYIAIGADRLFKQGQISAATLQRILNYTQLNHGQDVYLFMSQRNLTAEEFCLGVSRGEIYLQF